MELISQKYAATFMPVLTPEPYAKRQQAMVVPIAKVVRTPQRIRSLALEATAW